jgi:hypothetical protein
MRHEYIDMLYFHVLLKQPHKQRIIKLMCSLWYLCFHINYIKMINIGQRIIFRIKFQFLLFVLDLPGRYRKGNNNSATQQM